MSKISQYSEKLLIDKVYSHSYFGQGGIYSCRPLETQGYCNTLYLLTTNKGKFILRVFGKESIDRVLEEKIQTLAYTIDIAPKPILLDIQNNFMISQFAEGRHKSILTKRNIRTLAHALRALHKFKTEAPFSLLEKRHSLIDIFTADPVVCHNDLNPQNILWGKDGAIIIDWEYAGVNDRYFDLASFATEFHFDHNDKRFLLEHYFANSLDADMKKLDAYITYYKHVCELWWKDKSHF